MEWNGIEWNDSISGEFPTNVVGTYPQHCGFNSTAATTTTTTVIVWIEIARFKLAPSIKSGPHLFATIANSHGRAQF